MSDDQIAAVLASLERLEFGQAKLRTDLMARMDRLQHRMDSLDEHMTVGLGHSDRVEQRSHGIAEDNRLLGEQLRSMTKILRQLESRIRIWRTSSDRRRPDTDDRLRKREGDPR